MKNKLTILLTFSLAFMLMFAGTARLDAQQADTVNIVFLTDDSNDDYHVKFIQDQGFNVTKFWGGKDINLWGPDSIMMLDTADLVILGRSLNSGLFQDSIERASWNAIKAPMFYISAFHARDSRNHLFASRYLERGSQILSTATAALPADPIFGNVTLGAGNTIEWHKYLSDKMVDTTGLSNGEWVISIGDTIPLLVRFDADVPFYDGGPDSAVAERVFWGFGREAYTDVSVQAAHFPITRVAKQVYLNEINRILGRPIVEANIDNTWDYSVIFVTDDDLDDHNVDFLRRQQLGVTKLWKDGGVQNWGADTLAMLDDADLVIFGRSINSGEFSDSIERAQWNAITSPCVYVSPWHTRSSRNHLFNSTSTYNNEEGIAQILLPADPIFDQVTLTNDSLVWWDIPSDAIKDATGTSQGTWVAQINDSVPLIVRFAPDVAFYAGGPDSAVAERVYFGFGIEPDQKGYFPLSRDAKQVYLAEICRLLDITTPEAVYGASDYTITFLTDDDNDDVQMAWLADQGFTVNEFWVEGDAGNIINWGADTMAMLDESDVIICGRSLNSSEFGGDAKPVWNNITAPLILNSIHAGRSSRINWFNSTSAQGATDTLVASTTMPDDPIFAFEAIDESPWLFAPTNFLYLPDTVTTNGTVVISSGDTIPFCVRFDAGVEFYDGAGDMAAAERVFFPFGGEPDANHFPLTQTAQKIYFAEIMRVLGGAITEPTLLGTNTTLSYLATSMGSLDPAFDAAVTAYTVALDDTTSSIEVYAVGSDPTGSVEGAGVIALTPGADSTVYVIAKSGIGQTQTYSLAITQPEIEISVETLTGDANCSIYPNPFNSNLTVNASEEISSVAIYDLRGSMVLNTTVDNTSANLDLSALRAGTYIIKVQGETTVFTSRIIKH